MQPISLEIARRQRHMDRLQRCTKRVLAAGIERHSPRGLDTAHDETRSNEPTVNSNPATCSRPVAVAG